MTSISSAALLFFKLGGTPRKQSNVLPSRHAPPSASQPQTAIVCECVCTMRLNVASVIALVAFAALCDGAAATHNFDPTHKRKLLLLVVVAALAMTLAAAAVASRKARQHAENIAEPRGRKRKAETAQRQYCWKEDGFAGLNAIRNKPPSAELGKVMCSGQSPCQPRPG